MIAQLRGTVEAVDREGIVLDVNGVGFAVRMPTSDSELLRAGMAALVYTHLSVAQDALVLYGFSTQSARSLFLQLQKASGVGPKAALSLLSTLGSTHLLSAIDDGNVMALTKAPGIGRRSAQKIILELSGTLAAVAGEEKESPDFTQTSPRAAAIASGLQNFGWSSNESERAVAEVMKRQGYAPDVPEDKVPDVLREALSSFDRTEKA